MKSIVRTIVVLTAVNLAMGSYALAIEAPRQQPQVTPVETSPPAPELEMPEPPMPVESPPMPESPQPTSVEPGQPPSGYRGRVVGRWPIAGRAGKNRVLVIPAAETKAEDIVAIHEDMYVMAHIFDQKAKVPRLNRPMFTDYGSFFGRDSRDAEAIYIQGYGALFLMEVDLPISAAPKPKQEKPQVTQEHVDPTWQKAKDELFSPKAAGIGPEPTLADKYVPQIVQELRTELIRALKHTANIRGLKPDEWIILTVVGGAQQPAGIASHSLPGVLELQSSQNVQPAAAGYGRGGYGAVGYSDGGYDYGVGGYGMGGFGAMGFPFATVLTIRAKKADVDAFAKGEMDFDQFQEHVLVLTYPHLSGQTVGGQPREAGSSRGSSFTPRR
jgi:hypothetical protein